jgi:hypothetical protein
VISSGSANNFLLEEWNTLEIFVWGDQIETSLNDELLTTFNETIPDEEIALGSDSVTHGNVSIDNLRFWNLDEINFGGQRDAASGTSDSATSFDYEQTLAYIQGELPPTFEDDFTVSNEMWGVASDQRWIHNMRQAYLLEVTNQEDGGLTFPTNGLLDASNFAMRFDFNNETNQPVDRIGIMFSAAGDRNPYYRTYINWLSPVGPYLALDQINEDGDLIDLDQNEISYNPGPNTYLILVYDNHLVFYLNGVPVYTTDIITRSKMVNQLFITGSQGSNIQIDNITFWNLDGVEINLVD